MNYDPTHLAVTIISARRLLTKGKNGTNNCFVTIALGKDKYHTSIKEKALQDVDWSEGCTLLIPDHGNRAELILTCLHRNNLGIDEFLGQVTLPLNQMDDHPTTKWYKMESKPGHQGKKNKDRGELEVRIEFIVKSGSLNDLSKKEKHKSSIGRITGSLMSVHQRSGIRRAAASVGNKLNLITKKNKGGDNVSINGSMTSIGTPNFNQVGRRSRNIEDRFSDEEDFVFNNLTPQSSTGSINVDSLNKNVPRNNSSPFSAKGGKVIQRHDWKDDDDFIIDPELEQIENDFSVRARVQPPPSKPPRSTPYQIEDSMLVSKPNVIKEDEEKINDWENKLYSGKHLDIGSSDSLKRRSWEQTRFPLPTSPEEEQEFDDEHITQNNNKNDALKRDITTNDNSKASITESDSSSTESEEEEEEEKKKSIEPIQKTEPIANKIESQQKPKDLKLNSSFNGAISDINLISPDQGDDNDKFKQFNETFARFEKQNRSQIFKIDDIGDKLQSKAFIDKESTMANIPKPLPKPRPRIYEKELVGKSELKVETEDKKTDLEIEYEENGDKLTQVEAVNGNVELKNQQEEEERKRREAKRRDEDQRILNFAKRSISGESDDFNKSITPEKSPVNTRDAVNILDKRQDAKPQTSSKLKERVIVGRERTATHSDRRSELSETLVKKYEGKSREELMLIANGMENEALKQRQRVKELEDYLDNLLLRVMETQPKILQNPYSRTTSAKSFKNYINMNDFL